MYKADKPRTEIISIHTLRVEGDVVVKRAVHAAWISIHTLRVEGDNSSSISPLRFRDFNPHPPRGG